MYAPLAGLAPGGAPTQVQADFDNTTYGIGNSSRPVVMMEHMRNGSLKYWLARATYDQTRFRDEALWRILRCLVEACIAMKYPPRRQRRNPHPANPYHSEDGPPIPEVIPRPHLRDEANYIHFDIDPSNVFVGDFDAAAHANMPIVKVRQVST